MRRTIKLTALAAGLLLLLPAVVAAQDGMRFLELEDEVRQGIPPDCSTWHELYPENCVPHHQSAYEDNGDGELSPCDYIYLDGESFHVEWVGPTYYLDCEIIAEPMGDGNPENPVCEEWVEIWPDHGVVRHVIEWQDNGDGVVSPCDIIVFSDGLQCHIVDIGTNIRVVPEDTPARDSTWSRIKGMFKDLF